MTSRHCHVATLSNIPTPSLAAQEQNQHFGEEGKTWKAPEQFWVLGVRLEHVGQNQGTWAWF